MIAKELLTSLNETIKQSIAMTEQSILLARQHANNLSPEQLKELEKAQEIAKNTRLDLDKYKQQLHGINI